MEYRDWRDFDSRCPNKEDSSQNPYYNQPTHSPYLGQGFAIASMVFGGLSFLLNCIVGVPFICAGFSFLFGALAQRKGKRRSHFVFYGFCTSCFGIGSGIFTLMELISQLESVLP